MRSISELPRHPTEIYVIGSGRSLQYIRKDFWKNKITIGINGIYKYYPIMYGITQHTSLIQEMIDDGVIAISPEFDMGLYSRPREKIIGEYYVFKHFNNLLYDFSEKHKGYLDIDLSDFDNPETLVVGGITTSAIHLAYRMGATSIILAGIDGGDLDGKRNQDGYPPVIATAYMHTYEMQPQIDLICNEVRKRGVGVYSLNPFNNFRLEGHKYEPSKMLGAKEKQKNDSIYLHENRYDEPKEMFKFVAAHAFNGDFAGSVCDFGCASGEFLYYINQIAPSATLHGVDCSKPLLDKAIKYVPSAQFKNGSVLDNHLLPDDQFDTTFMSGLLCMLTDFKTCFNNLIKWTKPGGSMYITEMFNPYPVDVLVTYKESVDFDYDRNWNIFSQQTISDFLKKNKKVKSFAFKRFTIPIDLPRPDDHNRSWTICEDNGLRSITNGVGVIQYFYLLEIKL